MSQRALRVSARSRVQTRPQTELLLEAQARRTPQHRQGPLACLPAELLCEIILHANLIHEEGTTVFEVMDYMKVCRRVYQVLKNSSALWTRVSMCVKTREDVAMLSKGIEYAVERSKSRPLAFSIGFDDALVKEEDVVRVAGEVFKVGERWEEISVGFRLTCDVAHIQTWISELSRLTSLAGSSPFTNVQSVALFREVTRSVVHDPALWPLKDIFPNAQLIQLEDIEFHSAHLLPAQLAIPTLEMLTMTVHRLRDVHSETSWVGDVLTHAPGLKELDVCVELDVTHLPPGLTSPPSSSAPVATGSGNSSIVPVSGGATPRSSTPSPRVHTSLECLSLGQDRKWMVEEMRGWVYPALNRLELLHHPFLTLEDGAPGADIDIVGEILAMVQLSKCRLEYLDLRYMGLPNEELVRLLVALPDLICVELYVAEEVDENLFTMLRERSAGDESVLPRLECLGVRTCMWPMNGAKHTFDTQSFVDFVEDPRRVGGGPFAKIQRVCLMFDEEVKYIRS